MLKTIINNNVKTIIMTDKFPIHLLEKETYSFKKTQIWAYMYMLVTIFNSNKKNKIRNQIL